MSVKVMSMVWERLGVGGGELLLALALADRCDDAGGSLFESVRRLGLKTRQSPRTVRRQLARFREMGWLQVVRVGGVRGGKRAATRYQINPLWMTGVTLSGVPEATPDKMSGVDEEMATGGTRPLSPVTATPVTAVSANPSVSINDPKSADARPTPTGSRAARGRRPPEVRTLDERLAAARELLTRLPDFPLPTLRTMYGLSKEDLETVTGPVASYAGSS